MKQLEDIIETETRVLEQNSPSSLEKPQKNLCVVGLFADPQRLSEIRKTRANVNQAIDLKAYTVV